MTGALEGRNTNVRGLSDPVGYVRSAAAVRERCGQILALGRQNALRHFIVREELLSALVSDLKDELFRNYPHGGVPFHSRWRHFGVGGVDREALMNEKLSNRTPTERARAKLELAFVSVLLDAGAGDLWVYRDADCRRSFGRSEGLAVASLEGFKRGVFGSEPYTVTEGSLSSLKAQTIMDIFQVSEANPLLGVEGRVSLLRRVGEVVSRQPEVFSGAPGRLGGMLESIAGLAKSDGVVHAGDLLQFILSTFSPIWPGRISIGSENLGDVWRHPLVSGKGETDHLVPFHKLSQWLTYSLLEPLMEAGVTVGCLDELTGLAEYRNGGLFIDSGVLALREPEATTAKHHPGSEIIVEWRALTVTLLDLVAVSLREQLGLSAEELPLAKVLQGGTWSLGRKYAAERRPHATPPLAIESDGTVF